MNQLNQLPATRREMLDCEDLTSFLDPRLDSFEVPRLKYTP